MPTDKDETRSRRRLSATLRPERRGSDQPVTGSRRVPRQRDVSSGTAGTLTPGPFSGARGGFQVLVRVQHLRTQVYAWRTTPERGAAAARVDELLNALRGIAASAQGAEFVRCARLCERTVRHLENVRGRLQLRSSWLARIAHWLNRAERDLRHPAALLASRGAGRSGGAR